MVQDKVTQYAKQVEKAVQNAYSFLPEGTRPTVAVEVGKRYFKLITVDTNQRSVHSFVDRTTGDVFKPAGWAKPAKGARYNLVQDLQTLLNAVDPYGSYLYMR